MAISTDINEALLQDLFAIYSDVENQMLVKVAKRVKKGITEEGWNEQKLKDTQVLKNEIESLLNNKNKLAKLKVGKGILNAYKHGVNSAENDAGKPLTAMKELNVPLSIQNMLLTNYNLIDDASSKILRKANDAYRDVMAESATGLLSGVDTRVQVSQKMMDKLAAKGITSFTDKAGRTWQMSSYVEMAMRTASAHAALEGHIQTQQSFGYDLIKVSSIATTCPICARWQGVVLSISGKTPGYYTVDQARAAGLFHPNCKHTLIMFDPELDGPGQKELNSDVDVEKVTKKYDLIQKQRHNERMIRYWKRREMGAIDPKAKKYFRSKAQDWSVHNAAFCEKHGLRRMRQREGVKVANSQNAQFVDWFGKHLMGYNEDDLAKIVLDESIIKQALKDKTESLTTLYKKYLGENPAQDYKDVGVTQLTYAQWLKAKVMELTQDIPDPVDEMFSGASAMTPDELKSLKKTMSPTEIYKAKIGASPAQDYKTKYTGNLTYAQWLTAQVNDLAMDKVYSTHSFIQGQAEIAIESTKHANASMVYYYDLPPNLQAEVGKALNQVSKTASDLKMPTKVSDVVSAIKLATPEMGELMSAKGQGAVVKAGKIYINPSMLGKINSDVITHEIGHLVTKDGLKTSSAKMQAGADELLANSKYKSFKEMASKVSTYACKSPTEFFAECFSIYSNEDIFDNLPKESQQIVYDAVMKMYTGGPSAAQASPGTPISFDEPEPIKKPKSAPTLEELAAAKAKGISETDLKNFDKAKKIWDDKIAADGDVGFGTTKKALAQVYGLDIEKIEDEEKFEDMWVKIKKASKPGDYAKFADIKAFVSPMFNSGKLEDILAFDDSHPIAKIKAKEKAEQEAQAQAVAQAKAQAAAQAAAKAQSQMAAKAGASGYVMGFGKMTQDEQAKFIEEFNQGHLSESSSEGRAQKQRLAKQQKEYMKNVLGVDVSSSADAKALEKKVKSGTATPEEAAIYAMHDYTRASGVYSWYMRGVNRHRSVSTSDHPIGVGMTEWEYGEKMSKHINKYFEQLPPLEEDVYVHRVFGQDALENLFGIESSGAKSNVALSKMLEYSREHPGETLIRDYSALSTSTFQEGSWNGNCEVKLKLNKGTKAAFMGPIEAHSVSETTLKPNQKIRVNAVYERSRYTSSEWDKLAREKGFNPNREVVLFADTVPDIDVEATIEAKVKKIDDAISKTDSNRSLVNASLTTELSKEHRENSNRWASDEKDAVVTYTGGSYRAMNQALRQKEVESSSYKEKIKLAKSALSKASTSEDRVYRRGADFRSLVGMLGEPNMGWGDLIRDLTDHPEKYNSGTRVVFDDGFLSTTPIASGGFHDNVDFKIFAPAGTKAAYVAPISLHKSEKETVFQAGTRFRLLKIEEKRGNFSVYLEALYAED